MRAEIRSAVKEIRADRDSGARQLALAALRALASVAQECTGEELRESCRALSMARPMMTALENAMAWAWSRYLDTADPVRAVQEAIELIESAPEGMALAARKVIPPHTLMTYGFSSSVVELLTRLKPLRVIVSEARPHGDGLRVARELVAAGISMTLITEAQIALFVQEAGAVVVGADTILPDGDFINRIGTRLLALAAKDADVPFYAASETMKVAAPSEPLPFAPEEGNPKEVCADKWLEVRNVRYEVTPARLVTAYVTEHGLLDPAEVGSYALEAERRWQSLINSHEV